MKGLLEEGRRQARGQITDRTQWNKVVIDNSEVIVERAAVMRGRVGVEEIKYSFAYEKKYYKDKCALCKMYFEKRSVCYKVPIHRVLDLQESWNVNRDGSRFKAASLLYTMASVCVFCSQLFDAEKEVISTKGLGGDALAVMRKKLPKKSKKSTKDVTIMDIPPKPLDANMIVTKLARKDVALNQRAYQSSTVDDMPAPLAVGISALTSDSGSPVDEFLRSIAVGSKTRRELDPWWEVDLDRYQHVSSISAIVGNLVNQSLVVHVILLKKAIGFENPFLQSVLSSALMSKEFVLPAKPSFTMEQLEWELPPSTICKAIRLQIKGCHALNVFKVQAFQGDDIVPFSAMELENELNNSFASLSPETMRKGWVAIDKNSYLESKLSLYSATMNARSTSPSKYSGNMKLRHSLSMELPATRSGSPFRRQGNSRPSSRANKAEINVIAEQINLQKDAVRAWRVRALESVNFFTVEELIAIRNVIFLPILKEANVPYTNPEALEGISKMELEHPQNYCVGYGLSDDAIRGEALIAYFPRCPGVELVKRLKLILRWMYTRENVRIISVLLSSDKFIPLANDGVEHVSRLHKGLYKCEDAPAKDMNTTRMERLKSTSSVASVDTVPEAELSLTYSWSEVVMIIHLFCLNVSHGIKFWVFPKNNFELVDCKFKSAKDYVEHLINGDFSRSIDNSRSLLYSSQELDDPFANLVRPCTALVPENGGVLDRTTLARQNFIHYRIKNVSHRLIHDIPFPKTLKEAVRTSDMRMKAAKEVALEMRRCRPEVPTTVVAPMLVDTADFPVGNKGSEDMFDPQGDTDSRHGTSAPMTRNTSMNDLRPSTTANVLGSKTTSFNDLSAAAGAERASMIAGRPSSVGAAGHGLPVTKSNFSLSSEISANLSKPRPSTVSFGSPIKPTSPLLAAVVEDQPVKKDVASLVDECFSRSCALCMLSFPNTALEMKVLWKHVLKIRRAWDPTLVPKEWALLDQNISQFNQVLVCAFCAQYFDPDYPEGIVLPEKEPPKVEKIGIMKSLYKEQNPILSFIDTRHMPVNLGAVAASPTRSSTHPSTCSMSADSSELFDDVLPEIMSTPKVRLFEDPAVSVARARARRMVCIAKRLEAGLPPIAK